MHSTAWFVPENPKAVAIIFSPQWIKQWKMGKKKKKFNFRIWRLTQHIALLSKLNQEMGILYIYFMFVVVIK